MVNFDNIWLDKNSMQFNLTTDFPQVSIKIDGQETFINPSANPSSIPLQIATVSFGKIASTFICTWSQVTYEKKEIKNIGKGVDILIEDLFDIQWYRADQIHINSQRFEFKQGHIAGNMHEPITIRFESSSTPTVGFQYGDCIALDHIITGIVGNEFMLNQYWWNYITKLLYNNIFTEASFNKINKHILGVFEKNGFETKG